MIGRYLIMIETINTNGGYAVVVEKNYKEKEIANEHDAKQLYYDKLSQYGGNPSVAELRVTLLRPDGVAIRQEEVDNSVEPQTEE